MMKSKDSNKTSSSFGLLSNLFISFIGSGVLGLPYAFKQSGILEGSIVMIFVCYFSIQAMLLIVSVKDRVGYNEKKRINTHINGQTNQKSESIKPLLLSDSLNLDSHRVDCDENKATFILGGCEDTSGSSVDNEITYGDVAFAAFGFWGQILVEIALLLSQVGFCSAYLLFISSTLEDVIGGGWNQNQWLFLLLPPLFCLTLIPDLGRLAIFSFIAQVSNLLAFVVVFWFDFSHLRLAPSIVQRREFAFESLPFFFSISVYCFEGAGMVLSLENSIQDELKPFFGKYLSQTVWSITFLYISFGMSGYLSYGEDTCDIITLNIGSDVFGLCVKTFLCVGFFFTYPLMLFPVFSILEDRLFIAGRFVIARLLLVTLSGLVVVVIPKFADMMSLVGSTCGTFLGFIMPGLCHLSLFRGKLSLSQIAFNYWLIVIGVFTSALGIWDLLKNLMRN